MITVFSNCIRPAAVSLGLAVLLLVMLVPVAFAAEGFASLEEQMSGDEFKSAGLDKLSPQELASLNAWIRARSLATLDAPRSSSVPMTSVSTDAGAAKESDIEKMPREPIVARINGKFSGWDGKTVFKLENGMIWAQADGHKFYTQELQNPTVTIEPAMFGTWKLTVEGHDDDCRVRRIQ